MYSRSKGMQDARSAIQEYDSQIENLQSELLKTSQTLNEINSEREQTRQQLASGLLTTNSEEEVINVANEIGAIHLKTLYFELIAELERDKSLLDKTKKDSLYINREHYLHPLMGTITEPLEENEAILKDINKIIDELESAPHFHWVKKHSRDTKNVFFIIKSIATLSFIYKNKRFYACQEKVGDLPTAFDKHDEFVSLKQDTTAAITSLKEQKKPIIETIERVESLSEKISTFKQSSLHILRNAIAEHFKACDLRQMLLTIRQDAKILLSKLDALKNKHKHLEDIIVHIESEISDRQQRKSKIQTVLYKWQRSKKSYLSGDKSKWLVDTPSGARRRTNRFVHCYSDNTQSISEYNDYNSYSSVFCTGLLFSSFAVFASDSNIDNYAAREIYSEHSELSNTDAEMINDSDLNSVIASASLDELGLPESDSFDEIDAS